MDPVISVEGLVVEYGKGKATARAVDGIGFTVSPGECVGFVGANGAGKSSTIKSLMGFLFPRAGAVRVFGHPAGTVDSRRRTGYLPEVALYYPFMKARELLELYGGLHGLAAAALRKRIPNVLAKVGLEGKGEILLRSFSKGMQQRLGIAQALIAEPELLIFDELSSGLDPLGRHDLRNVLRELKEAGRTIFFSSHELTEVEALCDRILVIHRGRLVKSAKVADLMKPLNQFEITFGSPNGDPLPHPVDALGPVAHGEVYQLVLGDVDAYSQALSELTSCGCRVVKTASRTRSVEDYFIELVREGSEGA